MPPKQKNEPPKRKAPLSAKKAPPPAPSQKKKAPAIAARKARPPKYSKDMPVKDMIILLEHESESNTKQGFGPGNHSRTPRHRPEVKEKIFKTYELDDGARKLQALLENDQGVKNNSLLMAQFQTSLESMRTERDEILAIDKDLLSPWERSFRIAVQHKIKTGGVYFGQRHHHAMSSWVLRQKKRYHNIATMKKSADKPAAVEDAALLKRIGFDLDTRPNKTKSFDERFQELVAYKEEHGNLKIRRLAEGNNLGEWVAKVRREYDRIQQQGETATSAPASNLTPCRIQAMSDLGFIWKVRFGRPKKGDPQFRLRRKSKEGSGTGGDEEGAGAATGTVTGAVTATPEEANRGEDNNNDEDDDVDGAAAAALTTAAAAIS
jgi:hypothetical protein